MRNMDRTVQGVLAAAVVLTVATTLVLLRDDRFDAAPAVEHAFAAFSTESVEMPGSTREPVAITSSGLEHRDDSRPPEETNAERAPFDGPSVGQGLPFADFPTELPRLDVIDDGVPPDVDLVHEPSTARASEADSRESEFMLTLRTVWKHAAEEGVEYGWVAVDPRTKDLYVYVFREAGTKNEVLVLGPTGDRKREFETAHSLNGLHCAALRRETSHLEAVGALDLVGYVLPGGCSAVTAEGQSLWSVTVDLCYDIECVADIDRDGLDELILSCGVYDHRGVPLWSTPELGQTMSAAVGDVVGDEGLEVILASVGRPAPGHLRLYDPSGKELALLAPSLSANVVRSVERPGKDLIVGVDEYTWSPNRLMVAFGATGTGELVWRHELPFSNESAYGVVFEVDAEGRWGAIAIDESSTRFLVYLVDLRSGALVAGEVFPKAEDSPLDVAWLPTAARGHPLLVIATVEEVVAFEIVERRR